MAKTNFALGPDGSYTTNAKGRAGALDVLQFPSDIGSLEGTTNYMVIYINELDTAWKTYSTRPESKEQRNKDVPSNQASPTSGSRALGQVVSKAGLMIDNAGNSVVNSINSGAKSTFGATQNIIEPNERSVQNFMDSVYPQYKRTDLVIALPIPEQLNTAYNTDWSQANMSPDERARGTEAAFILMADSPKEVIQQRMKISAATTLASMAVGEGAATFLTKSVRNPRRELLFSGSLPRGFNFTWNLFPKNEEESKAIWDIVQMLKLQMLPEYDAKTEGMYINFPSTFEFEFYTNHTRNDWLFKSSSCALTALDVNYTPTGTATFFKENKSKASVPFGSAPNGIALSLNFMETELLFKNRIDIDKDYSFNSKQKGTLGGVL